MVIGALKVAKALLFTVIPLLASQSIATYSDPAPAQVVIGALKVTNAIYSDPAPWVPKVSLLTVIPPPPRW